MAPAFPIDIAMGLAAVTLQERLAERLAACRLAGLERNPPVLDGREAAHVRMGGQWYINFSSNDYLGLGTCAQWRQEVSQCHAAYAPSASSSRLVTGNWEETEAMENAFAAYFGYEACLFFPSGYQANGAVLSGLLMDAELICYDKRIHASMAGALPRDGVRLRGYAHSNLEQLDRKLGSNAPGAGVSVQPVVLTEALFSMDGDTLDIDSFRKVVQRHGAFSIVDEAHSIGVLGAGGRGVAAGGADILVGTLGKAFGLSGAFVLMPAAFKGYLTNFSAPVIYSTSVSPAFAACALAALQRVASMDVQRARLASNSAALRGRLQAAGLVVAGDAHILAIEVGEESKAVCAAQALQQRGLLVFAARYPTVPEGRAMLRVSVTAAHTQEDLTLLATAMQEVLG